MAPTVAFFEDSQLITFGYKGNLVRTWSVPLSESQKELQQKTIQLRPRSAPMPTSRFFDNFDPHSPPGCNNHATTATRHAKGSGIKNTRAHSSPLDDHGPRPHRIPLVDILATRGKYHTANAHSGKRHKLAQLKRPPRQQVHAGASSSSTPRAETSNVTDGAITAMFHTGGTIAATSNKPPSALDAEHVPDISCLAVLAKRFPCLSRTRQTNTAVPPTR